MIQSYLTKLEDNYLSLCIVIKFQYKEKFNSRIKIQPSQAFMPANPHELLPKYFSNALLNFHTFLLAMN